MISRIHRYPRLICVTFWTSASAKSSSACSTATVATAPGRRAHWASVVKHCSKSWRAFVAQETTIRMPMIPAPARQLKARADDYGILKCMVASPQPGARLGASLDLSTRALEALDVAIAVIATDLRTVLLTNACASEIIQGPW